MGPTEALAAALDRIDSDPGSYPVGTVEHAEQVSADLAAAGFAIVPIPQAADREAAESTADLRTAWLIEQGQPEGHVPPIYYTTNRYGVEVLGSWTADPYRAGLFSDHEQAEAYITAHNLPGRAVEHGFMGHPPAAADRLAEAERLLRAVVDGWDRQPVQLLRAPGYDGPDETLLAIAKARAFLAQGDR